jgi:uncharacterized tellurite resistance protein B-like protein
MSKEFMEDRRKALEEQFFAEHNKKLLQKLQEKAAKQAKKESISSVLNITDEQVLDQLVNAGLCCETVMALVLVPMLEVAWADGEIQDNEREAIIRAAEEQGIAKGSIAHDLLESWLKQPIPAEMMETWKSCAGSLKEAIDPAAYQAMRKQAITRARVVAESAGGFLGLSKISAKEKAILEELEAAF